MVTTAPTRRRRRPRTTDDWTSEFARLVDNRECDHGAKGPRYCGLCKQLARHIANLTGVREYR